MIPPPKPPFRFNGLATKCTAIRGVTPVSVTFILPVDAFREKQLGATESFGLFA
jgi:hypothetical protein